ncbi:MAG: CDP-alcohol phosphatidyltransferase family protein [Bacteroidota bacterium]
MKAWLPNLITLINLFCGCVSAVLLVNGHWPAAALVLLAGLGADFFDGIVARALKVSNPLGKELDSMADMVSFGFLPGLIYYHLLYFRGSAALPESGRASFDYLSLVGFLVTLFAALRLAKFNIDERQTSGFIGLATPSSMLFAVGLLWIASHDFWGLGAYALNPAYLIPTIVLMSYLQVAELPMFSFKLKEISWSGNELRFIFAAVAMASFFSIGLAALPFIILLYVLLNLGRAIGRKTDT